MRLLPDGKQVEEQVDVPPEYRHAGRRMLEVIRRDGSDLLLANLLLQSRGLVEVGAGTGRSGA